MSYQYVREPLTAEESDRLSKACQTPTERLVVWTLLDTGLRVGELCDLTPKNVLWQQRLAAKSMTRSRGSPDRINSQGLLSKGYLRRRIASQAGPPRDSSSERSPSWMPCLRSSIQSSGSGARNRRAGASTDRRDHRPRRPRSARPGSLPLSGTRGRGSDR